MVEWPIFFFVLMTNNLAPYISFNRTRSLYTEEKHMKDYQILQPGYKTSFQMLRYVQEQVIFLFCKYVCAWKSSNSISNV